MTADGASTPTPAEASDAVVTGDAQAVAAASPPSRRELVALLSAVGVSTLGTRMSFLAVPWFVLTTSGRAVDAGVVALAELGPYVLVQAFGGPVVDRWGLRRSSIVSDLTATLFVGAIPVLAIVHLNLPTLACLLAVAGAARGAGDTARTVLVPVCADRARTPLERAAGLVDGFQRAAALGGAPLAGVLITVISPLTVLAIDAGTFAVSAVVVLIGLRSLPTRAAAASPRPLEAGYFALLAEGLRYLRGDRLLLGIAVMVLITNTLDQANAAVLTPSWATTIARSSVALGLVGAAFSGGAVAGNLLLAWIGPRLPRRLTFGVGFLLAGAPRYFAMALIGATAPVVAVAVVSGLGAGGLNPALGAVEYERTPPELQPRVLGALGAVAWAGIPVGSLLGGVASDALGLRTALLVAGSLYLLTTLAPFVFPAWRGMNRQDLSA